MTAAASVYQTGFCLKDTSDLFLYALSGSFGTKINRQISTMCKYIYIYSFTICFTTAVYRIRAGRNLLQRTLRVF